MAVSVGVPRATVMASFCKLSSFSRLDCVQGCETQTKLTGLSITVIQQEQMTLFDVLDSHGCRHRQSFLALDFD